MAIDVGSAKGYLDLDISGFLSGLKTAQSEADSTTKSISSKIGSNLSSAGKSLSSVGSTLTKTVTLPLLGIGAAGLKVATDFEKGMSEVKAISGATGKDFDALKDKAVELGASTAFSAGEVAEAMTEMAKAGWGSQQIIDGMGGVLDAAAASGEGLGAVSTIVADAITGFGLEAKDSTKVADLLTQAANSGTIGITDLGESFKYVAPIANSMGVSIEDATTAIAAMSMAGIKGSQAGTSLRTILSSMTGDIKFIGEGFDDMVVKTTNADGSMREFSDVLADLRVAFSGMTEQQRASNAENIAGKTGMSAMLALLNLTEEEYNAIAESMGNANGVAQKTAAIMQDNLQSKVEQLFGSLESLAIKLADFVLPSLQKFVEWLTSLVEKFTALDPEMQKTILKFAGLAAAAGPVLLIIGKLVSGVGGIFTAFSRLPGIFSTITTSITKVGEGFKLAKAGFTSLGSQASPLGAALGGITAPVAAVIAVVAVLVGAFVTLWKKNEDFRNNIANVWNEIKQVFVDFVQGIKDRLGGLGIDFAAIGETIKNIWFGFCDLLAPYFEANFNFVLIILRTVFDYILAAIDFFVAVFTGDWQGAWEAIKSIFEIIWTGIKDWFFNLLNMFTGMFDVALGWFGTSWEETWNSVSSFFMNIWNTIKDFFVGIAQYIWQMIKPLLDEIVGAFQMAWDVIKLIWSYVQPYFAGIWEGIKAVFSIVGEWFKLIFSVAWEYIKAAWSVVVAWFKLLWENLKAIFKPVAEFFKGIFNIAWEAIKAIWNVVVAYFTMVWAGIKAVFAVVKGVLSGNFSDAWNAIKNLWDKVINYFSTIWNGIKNVFGAVVNFFKNTFSAAWEAIKKVFSNFGTFFSSLWNTIKNTFTSIGTKIGNAISGAVKSGINGVLGMIEGTVNSFIRMINGAINLINLIPGVNISKLSQIYIPRLAKGGVVNSATIAMFGEDGREAVIPLEKNIGWMKNLVKEFINRLGEFFDKQIKFNEYFDSIINICRDILEVGKQFSNIGAGYVPYGGFGKSQNVNRQNDDFDYPSNDSGDTFIFHSPKPIDEIEAAKQMKKAKRDLAEGF